jgi:hypothetical protein
MPMFNEKINYKWPFSIAMLNYQRVSLGLIKHVFFQGFSQSLAEFTRQKLEVSGAGDW